MAIQVEEAFRNVVQQLQAEPRRYKLFGVYWWAIKALLRGAGYDKDQLYMLGDYRDPAVAELVPPMPLEETLAEAFEEYRFNAQYPRSGGMVESPDGELVKLYDEDAGL